jgi:ribonuclease BN (tRNA processing enzyme)
MIILEKSYNKDFLKILGLLLSLMLIQGCKAYKSPTNLEQAAKTEEKGVVKVTMVNGDEYIYENIEFSGDTYYGVKMVNAEKEKTVLLKEDVLKVERKSKSSFGALGIAIGLGSAMMAILMF